MGVAVMFVPCRHYRNANTERGGDLGVERSEWHMGVPWDVVGDPH